MLRWPVIQVWRAGTIKSRGVFEAPVAELRNFRAGAQVTVRPGQRRQALLAALTQVAAFCVAHHAIHRQEHVQQSWYHRCYGAVNSCLLQIIHNAIRLLATTCPGSKAINYRDTKTRNIEGQPAHLAQLALMSGHAPAERNPGRMGCVWPGTPSGRYVINMRGIPAELELLNNG